MIDRRTFLLSGTLCAGGLGALSVHPAFRTSGTQHDASQLGLPEAFGVWRTLPAESVILPPADALSKAAYEQIAVAAYSNGQGPAIVVLVAYGPLQTHALQLHRPETCYPSSGFEILEQKIDEVALAGRRVPAGWMEAQRGNRIDRLLYWTRIGTTFTRDLWDQRLTIARNAFQGAPSDGVLVRISMEAEASEQMDLRLVEFCRAWLEALRGSERALLLGPRR